MYNGFCIFEKVNVYNSKRVYDIIITHLNTCNPKEISQHSKRSFVCIKGSNYIEFMQKILINRFGEMSKSLKKRVSKVLKKIENAKYE